MSDEISPKKVKPSRRVVGWLLSEEERDRLLIDIPARYPDLKAHHVTLEYGVPKDPDLIPPETEGTVVGIADDDRGIQALVVEIGGTTRRPDGSVYHITWSLDESLGYEAVMSNDLIRNGWKKIDPRTIQLEPGFFY